jgi:hypothetical protein
MKLFTQLIRPFSIRGMKTGSEWRPKPVAVLTLYAAVFGFGYLLACPVAYLGMMMGLGAIANCTMTLVVIVGGMLLLMWVFDKFVAGPIAIHPRLVRALFYEVKPQTAPGDR